MTSMNRQIARSNPNYDFSKSRPQLTEYDEDGGYKTLHPTKGWKSVSAKRVAAQLTMMNKFGFVR